MKTKKITLLVLGFYMIFGVILSEKSFSNEVNPIEKAVYHFDSINGFGVQERQREKPLNHKDKKEYFGFWLEGGAEKISYSIGGKAQNYNPIFGGGSAPAKIEIFDYSDEKTQSHQLSKHEKLSASCQKYALIVMEKGDNFGLTLIIKGFETLSKSNDTEGSNKFGSSLALKDAGYIYFGPQDDNNVEVGGYKSPVGAKVVFERDPTNNFTVHCSLYKKSNT